MREHTEEQNAFEDQVLLKELLSMYYVPSPEQKALSLKHELAEEGSLTQFEELIGTKRKTLCRELEQEIAGRNGVLCVRGSMGSGKSVFIDRLAICLRAHYKNTSQIDLTRFQMPGGYLSNCCLLHGGSQLIAFTP